MWSRPCGQPRCISPVSKVSNPTLPVQLVNFYACHQVKLVPFVCRSGSGSQGAAAAGPSRPKRGRAAAKDSAAAAAAADSEMGIDHGEEVAAAAETGGRSLRTRGAAQKRKAR